VKFALEDPAIVASLLLRAPVFLFVADNESEERRPSSAHEPNALDAPNEQ
jgi:hypothetical protein